MVKEPIVSKSQMYRLLRAGELGNTARFWTSFDEVMDSGYNGELSLRVDMVGHPFAMYRVKIGDLAVRLEEAPQDLVTNNRIIYCEAPPHHLGNLQGEVMQHTNGLYLLHTYVKEPMRIALAQNSREARRLVAKLILEHHLDASDLEHIYNLLEEYPGHVVEFSNFDVKMGTMKRRCCIWEVRRY